MDRFKNTLIEMKAAHGSPSKSKHEKRYAKLNPCPHDLPWRERTILEVISIDYNFSMNAIVRNDNGLEWTTPISHLKFCDANGNKV